MNKPSEIGSEFWLSSVKGQPISRRPWDAWPGEASFYVCGRTAMCAILEDILAKRSCRKAYLPSYCCETMIEPFVRYGLTVEFYPVLHANGKLYALMDSDKDCDILLWMEYFGFAVERPAKWPDCLIIQDMTHSLLRSGMDFSWADYLFASLRKWDAIAGAAVACGRHGKLPQKKKIHEAFVDLRYQAYRLKESFMNGSSQDKQAFLSMFSRAEDLLDLDYMDYCADIGSIERAATLYNGRCRRRENASFLLQGLKELAGLEAMCGKLSEADVPLFVPILVKDGKRDKLRERLIAADIYCPVHWPLSELHLLSDKEKEIYSQEISLVCDQRYGRVDMERELNVIRDFMSEYA